MDIIELKKAIEDKTISDNLLILKYVDCNFICKQYINAIAKIKNKTILYVNSISDIPDNDDVFNIEDNYLYVIDTDNFKEYPTQDNKNLIVMCKDLPENLTVDYIDIPKLVNWQIEAYVATRLKGLEETAVTWLCQICKYDIFRLNQECLKLEVFLPATQKLIFNHLNDENGYCDLNTITLFDLTDAIIKLDRNKISAILKDRDYLDLEPAGLITVLLGNYKKLNLVSSTSCWDSTMEVSEKQYNYFKKVICSKYKKKNSFSNILKMLTSIDYLIKSGKLEYNRVIDYVLMNLFSYI